VHLLLRAILFLAFLGGVPGAAHACSKMFLPDRRGDHAFFVGTAGTDTVLAGLGTVRLRDGRGSAARVFGQTVVVERLPESAPRALAEAVRRAGGRVVLVPWAYGPDCRPLRWEGSARWLPPRRHGLYFARLRTREHWAGAVPTLDVFTPEAAPYPYLFGRALPEVDEQGRRALSPEELMGLYDALPPGPAAAHADAKLAPLRTWMRRHADLAAREPARGLIAGIYRRANRERETERVRRLEMPLRGTYRFVMRLESGDSVVLFGRTAERAEVPFWSTSGLGPPEGLALVPAAGYSLRMAVARTPAELPTRFGQQDGRGYALAGFRLLEKSEARGRQRVWRGDLDAVQAASRMIGGRLDAALLRAAGYASGAMDDGQPTPAVFSLSPEGRASVRYAVLRAGRVVLEVHGERVSRQTAIDLDEVPGTR
jgi:hypothetical protein